MSESSQNGVRPIRPLKPVTPYLGGKRQLAARIIERIEAIPHTTYAEPFLGAGGVFLRRPSAPAAEVVNDYSREVVTFFRILQRHYPQFMETLKFQLTSRREFERLVMTDPDTLTDLERAGRFLYLQRTAFGGKISGRNFGVSPANRGSFDVTRLGPMLEELHERLAGVTIECLPWRRFVERYDRPGTLFYLDPPYWGCENDYGRGMFGRSEFEELASVLSGLKGRFLLSLNDVPEVRRIFSAFHIEAVELTYSIAGNDNAKRAREVIISGSRKS